MKYICDNCPIKDNKSWLCDTCKPYCDQVDKMFNEHEKMLSEILAQFEQDESIS